MLEGTELVNNLNVTMTPTMYVIGLVVALAVEFIKAVLSRFSFLTAEIKKPLFPLIGVVLSSMAFSLGGIENWLIAGVIIGLATGGGYDMFKGTSNLQVKEDNSAPGQGSLAQKLNPANAENQN